MRYKAFGLVWEVAAPAPFDPDHGSAPPDVRIRLETDQPLDPHINAADRTLVRDADGWWLRFTGNAGEWLDYRFRTSARTLEIATSRRADQVWAALEGIIPAILLGDRDFSLLHGSVAVDGSAKDARGIAVLGASGLGKSTLTAALAARGQAILSDDLIAFAPKRVDTVLAGSPRVGLLADAAARRSDLAPAGHRAAPGSADDKQLFRATTQAPLMAALSAIIILQPFRPGPPELTPLVGAEALAALRANRYGDWIRDATEADARHWLALISAVPLFALHRPRDLDAVDACADLLAGL